jgi:hypothetical protein
MKIKGKKIATLIKAYHRLKYTNPIKAGYIKRYLQGITTRSVDEV